MPQQLIYTSAPRGVVAGRSGYCTVARSASMREPVMLRLEQLSYYQHLSIGGGREGPIFTYRIVDIRGSRFHVLTRLQDAGLDFTGRTNFIAHHLVFTPEELAQVPVPPIILRDWPGWLSNWSREPQLMSKEDWSNLSSLIETRSLPGSTWQRVTGDAVNGYALLEVKAGVFLNCDGVGERDVLTLLAESAELLEVRDTRRDFRIAAWQYTFTTRLQEQDNAADFRWRFVQGGTPAYAKLGAAECLPISALRSSACTDEENCLARVGRQKPAFVKEPEDARLVEGHAVALDCQATGVPLPAYEWYEVDRANNAKGLVARGPALAIAGPPLGISRYVVRASNSAGEAISRVAVVSVEGKIRLQRDGTAAVHVAVRHVPTYVRSAEDIDRQRNKLQVKRAEQMFRKRQHRKIAVGLGFAAIALAAFAAVLIKPAIRDRIFRGSGRQAPLTNAASLQKVVTNLHVTLAERDIESDNRTGHSMSNQIQTTDSSVLGKDLPTLSSPWDQKVIGQLSTQPMAWTDRDALIVRGAGLNFNGREDSFFFVRCVASNSIEFSARLSKVDPASPQTLCGLMIRGGDDPGSPFVFVGASSTAVFCIQREMKGETCKTPRWDRLDHQQPISLRISRGSGFAKAEFEVGREQWKFQRVTCQIPADRFFVGFAVCSGNTNAQVTAYFDKISDPAQMSFNGSTAPLAR